MKILFAINVKKHLSSKPSSSSSSTSHRCWLGSLHLRLERKIQASQLDAFLQVTIHAPCKDIQFTLPFLSLIYWWSEASAVLLTDQLIDLAKQPVAWADQKWLSRMLNNSYWQLKAHVKLMNNVFE